MRSIADVSFVGSIKAKRLLCIALVSIEHANTIVPVVDCLADPTEDNQRFRAQFLCPIWKSRSVAGISIEAKRTS